MSDDTNLLYADKKFKNLEINRTMLLFVLIKKALAINLVYKIV